MTGDTPPLHHHAYVTGINKTHSPVLAFCVPWFSVMLGSMLSQWVTIASAPVCPPLGFLIMVSWRQIRPGLIPVWAGIPLGLFDDLFSGQPFGAGMMLWCVTMLGLDVLEDRQPWRNFVIDWLAASLIIVFYSLIGLALIGAGGGQVRPWLLLPQIALSICLFPMTGRLVGRLDKFRLTKFRTIS